MSLRYSILMVGVLLLCTASYFRSSLYQDERTLYADTLSKSQNKSRVLSSMALVLMKDEQFVDALPLVERAIALDPDNVPAKINLALTFYALGLKADAQRVFVDVAERYPSTKEAVFARKMLALP